MKGARVPASDYLIRSFRSTDQASRGPVLDAARAAGFTVERIEEDFKTPDKWGLILKPSKQVADLFRLDREVLLWCANYPRFQARDIEDIRKVIESLGVRLSRSFVILVSQYDPLTRSTIEAEAALDTTIVHCALSELRRPVRASGEPTLVRLLLDRLYTRDLYDLPVAITRAADFFGRRQIIDDIADEIMTGQTQIGIFGLRKIGKTSLVNRIVDTVAQSGRCIVAKLDLQWTTSIDLRPEHTLWSLGEAIYASGRVARSAKNLTMFGQFRMASTALGELSIWEAFAHDLTTLLRHTNRRIVIALDEIERLVELGAAGGFTRFWRLLRGFDQQQPGRLRFLVSGTSPECAEKSIMNTEDNPLYRYLSVRYLGPLDMDDSHQLLRALGQPTGLEWSAGALDYAVEQSGGHPALLRTLGSVVHRKNSPRSGPVSIDRPDAVRAAQSIVVSETAVLAQVTASLRDQYEDEFVMLDMLAQGQVFNFRQLASSYPDELSHLTGYGLLSNGIDSDHLAIGLLQTYVQALGRKTADRDIDSQLLQVDEYVDARRIVGRVSSGGFADVYVALDEADRQVAVKAFKAARLSALEREVEHLQMLEHPGIVRFLEATQSSSGVPCLIMEFIDGTTLAERCNATSAPDTPELLAIASKLLDALVYMHPDDTQAKAIANRSELSASEFDEWKIRRHGIVHRDIKPENVIMGPNGPVLIDFNIAVRAADSVTTLTATPGYLPPSFAGPAWTPDVDIYQFGVSFAQVGAGVRFDGENVEDLVSLTEVRHGKRVAEFIGRLLTDGTGLTAAAAAEQLASLTSTRR